MIRSSLYFGVGASLCILIAACGGSNDTGPPPGGEGNSDLYGSAPDKTVVVGGTAGTAVTTPTGDGCVTLPSGECVKPQKECKPGERADIIVDSKGKVVEIVCYPASATPTPIDGQGNIEIGKDNKAVVAIDGVDDGVDVAGDVTSSGNNVVVYGQGAGVSVIGGKVVAEGNNFSMRGVRVKGDVRITGNNATLVLCVVEGDVIIAGNNAVIADCTVLGKIQIEGNNSILVANEVGGGISVADAKNTVCDGNVAWSDANSNRILDPGESGAAIVCSGK